MRVRNCDRVGSTEQTVTYFLRVFDQLVLPASLGPEHANAWRFGSIVFVVGRNLA